MVIFASGEELKNHCGEPATALLASNREKSDSCVVIHGQRANLKLKTRVQTSKNCDCWQ